MMGASSRPAKRSDTIEVIDPYLALRKHSLTKNNTCSFPGGQRISMRRLSSVDGWKRQHFPFLSIDCHKEEEEDEEEEIEKVDDYYEEVLRLNVGGEPYRLKKRTIIQRSEGLLTEFANRNHAARIIMCDSYFKDTNEYFFERSAILFDQIYLFYITGEIHNPKDICSEVFIAELVFWNLHDINFPKCCWPQPKQSAVIAKLPILEEDNFESAQFGEIRKYIWNLIEVPESSTLARGVSFLSIITVLLSNIGLVVQSIPELQVNETKTRGFNGTDNVYVLQPHPFFNYLEGICVIWFTIEYLSKMLVAVNRRAVFLELMNIIDLVAILPFYIELFFHIVGMNVKEFQEIRGALLVVRIMRVLRVVRLFKLSRYSSGMRIFALTIQHSKEQLSMLNVVLFVGMMFFSTLVYFLEKDQPGTPFTSIPASFWWCTVTMTTVGYGDYVPQTFGGKLVAVCAISAGILFIALPITIIVDNFMTVQEELHMVTSSNNPFRRNRHQEEDENTVDHTAVHRRSFKMKKRNEE